MTFEPKTKTPPSVSKFIRISVEDLARIEKIAKEIGESEAEIIRQAISFALDNMKS